MTAIGELNQRVMFERPARSVNDAGETTVTWEAAGLRWARVRPRKGWQVERARAVAVNTTHEVRIRYERTIEAGGDWRIVWRGRILNVTGVLDEDGRKRWLDLDCEEEGTAAA